IYTTPYFSPFKYPTDLTFAQEGHILGTDSMGQDMLALILFGGRVSLSVGIVAATIAITVGTAVGALSGFFGGMVDSVLMRLTDLFISLPQLPLLLLISFLFKNSMQNLADRVVGAPQIGTFVLIVGV